MSQATTRGFPWAPSRGGFLATLAAALLGFGLAVAVQAGDCPHSKTNGSASASNAATGAPGPAQASGSAGTAVPGLRAFRDPETGQLRAPTAEEAAALTRLLASALAIPGTSPVVQHANGMLSVQLGEEYMNDVVVRRNPDGTLAWVCVPHPQSGGVLQAPPAKSPELEKE